MSQAFEQYPSAILATMDWLGAHRWQAVDLRPAKDPSEMIEELTVPKALPQLSAVGVTKRHCVVALWEYEKGIPFSSQPVVWLDSEGFPNLVFASDYMHLLKILCYDSGFIYNVLTDWAYVLDKTKRKFPVNKYDAHALQSMLKQNEEDYPEFNEFRHWLAQTLMIELSDNPLQIVEEAVLGFPSFDQWLAGFNNTHRA